MARTAKPVPWLLNEQAAGARERLSAELGMGSFDLLLIGDGSGSVYTEPAGWACLAYDRHKQTVIVHTGGLSCGTNSLAEVVPCLQALWHHHQSYGQKPQAPVHVHIVSDSEVSVRCGNGQYARNANGCLWAELSWCERRGYRLTWRHLARNSSVWNAIADEVAGYTRRAVETLTKDVIANALSRTSASHATTVPSLTAPSRENVPGGFDT